MSRRNEDQGSLFRSSAKRKLEASDLEDPRRDAFVHGDRSDDFTFQRRPWRQNQLQGQARDFARAGGQQEPGPHYHTERWSLATEDPEQALAAKSTNSPSKQVSSQKEKPKVSLDDLVVSGRPPMQADLSQAARHTATLSSVTHRSIPSRSSW